MNFEEFEKRILADPFTTDPQCLEQAKRSEACARLQRQAQALDQQLEAIMNVPCPPELLEPMPDMAALSDADLDSERLSADDNVVSLGSIRNRGQSGPAARWRVPVWAGVAASVALVAALFLREQPVEPVPTMDTGNALVAELVEHMSHEPYAMRRADTAVSDTALASVLNPARASVDEMPALVSYARSCIVNGRSVPHLVVQGEAGPVTLLLLPDESVDGPISIMQDGIEGVLLPVGNGSIAIMGPDKASVEAVRDQALAGVQFDI
ncbi:MAG: DUF3379 family protein [Pseudomonadota bacterium]